ncbi:MAG TPA: ATP-binding protein [Candidatus Acidoferrales bacterium]|jgi:nitrogen-specific signal transduction histidine kinase|nr:ATP-binding protein [Candidatus Acidoferrales bacterium]
MLDRERSAIRDLHLSWTDLIWLLFLGGLAVLPPVDEIHKQLILLAIFVVQLSERWLIARLPKRGPAYTVLIKILLATLLLDHTGEFGINSSYYPIYFLPIVSAAIYFGTLGALAWTTVASLAYLSLLIPALQEVDVTPEGKEILTIRVLFFYIAAVLVSRFAVENRRQLQRLQDLSNKLEQTNRQLRRAEAEARRAERLAALGQLSAGLAHEIRNPLGVIKGSADMLSRKVAGSEPLVAELAGYISSEVNRLNALVVRFLDFARPSKLELRPERISEIVDRAVEAAIASFPNAGVKIERQYAPNLPEIPADPQLCEHVFVNLITNAFQAMQGPAGSSEKTLRISIQPEVSNREPGVAVLVEDTGPGVPAELREQIFNPFFTSKKDGVGLGLSIVAKIVDDHRGTIRLEDNTPRGARFHVFFPQANRS